MIETKKERERERKIVEEEKWGGESDRDSEGDYRREGSGGGWGKRKWGRNCGVGERLL